MLILNKINSVNNRVIDNNQVIIDTRDKISELSKLKSKIDTLCAASNVRMSSSSRTFYKQGSNDDSTFKRQLKFFGVTESSELKSKMNVFLATKILSEQYASGLVWIST